MDTSKKRTDLLDAGRKKLQQFRQKNSKGNSSKSSKAGRSGTGATAGTAPESAARHQNIAGSQRSGVDVEDPVSYSESTFRIDSMTCDPVASTDSLSAKANTSSVPTSPAVTVEFPSEGFGVDETRLNLSAADRHNIDHGVQERDGLLLVLEDESHNVPGASDSIESTEQFNDSIPLLPIDFSSQPESRYGEEQVTDIGEMQEAGSSDLNKIDKGGGTRMEGHDGLSNELTGTSGDHITSDSGDSEAVESTHESAQTLSTGVAISNAEETQESHNLICELETVPPEKSDATDQQREGISSGLLNEEKAEVLDISGGDGDGTAEGIPASSGVIDDERSLELKIDDSEKPLGCKQVDLSSGLDGSLIRLSKLAEILQILEEDEFEFLFAARELSCVKFRDANKMNGISCFSHDVFERLKEQLYVTTLSKDAFHLELCEHQNLIDEISMTNASLNEVQSKNEILTEEIAQYRYELQEVVSAREELEKQLRFSKDEINAFSAEINELQQKLEMRQGDMSSLSSELVECRNLLGSLQAENHSLMGSFKLVTEEREKLFEDNKVVLLENEKMKGELVLFKASLEELQNREVGSTENLTLLRDDMKRLEEEKDYIVHDNSELLNDVAEYKREIERVRAENKNLTETLTSVSDERKKLGEENDLVVHQNEKLSNELMDCKNLVQTLEMEISNLNESLKSIMEERKVLEEEKKHIFLEYEKQRQDLAEMKVSEAEFQAECCKAVNDVKEAPSPINLVEENEILKTNLEFSKSNIKVFGQQESSAEFEEIANSSGENDVLAHQKPISYLSSSDQLKLNVYEDSSGFVALKGHLEEAETIVKKLEKAVESMHLYSHSLSRSNDKTGSSGVSKLIQAFESKSNVDDHETEEPPSENQTIEDPYMMTKMVSKDLGALLIDIVMDAENASEFCKGVMQSKLLTDVAGTELLSNYDALKEHTDQLEESSIQLMILYEAMRENVSDAVAKGVELSILCDAMQKQELILKSENIQLIEKLNDLQVKLFGVQSQLDETCKNSEETITSLSGQVKILQAEMANRQSIIEAERSIVAQVLQTVGELDAAVATFQPNSSATTSDNLDVVTHVVSSVAGVTKVIEDLQRQLEVAQIEYEAASDAYKNMFEKSSNLQVKNEMAENTLHILYNDLIKLVSETLQHGSDEIENVLVDDITQDVLHPDGFKTLLDQLKRFLEERVQLESANKQLKSELVNNTRDIDELEKQRLKADTIMKLVEDIECSLRKDGVEIYVHEPVPRIESLISLLFEKYKEAFQSLSLSTPLEMQLSELQGHVEHSNAMLVQYENENVVFKQSLKSAEEDAASLNSKLQEKMAELEQSEQRVASLREKLSIAVTKGKGLISQRDSLKQSLVEMSKELEKSSQELLSKDASLHEIESKLEVYAEAGERMEALESELSYIRNSATALRESFLLKDSTIQRIEEILEDLELPEHLYTGDIIEKIDWLAKSVTGNSFPLNEWDQRSSLGVGSHSDAEIVGVDRVGEEMKPGPNSSDDMRIRYEELQSKFYELAEQNEILEHSLLERNNHVQQWKEILDRIDMPSPLQSLEPEDKIKWLESVLSESQNQCSFLQQKIDNLESFCGSLTADLDDSQKRISELDSALQQACTEKENQCSSLQQKIDNLESFCGSLTANLEDSQRRISESDSDFHQACTEKETLFRDLEILRHDNYEISRKAADFQIRNENLQNEVNMLQEQRLQLEEDIHHTEAAVKRLQELVMDALQSSIAEDVVLDREGVNYLEEMLRNLVEKYKALSSEKPVDIDPVDVLVAGKGELSHVSRDNEEQEVVTMRKKLDDCMGDLMFLKEENDRYMLKNQSLLSEIEALDVAKNELQQLLSQEEQKSVSLREKLNVAVRKGKSLVQQRDGMKQVIEELNAEVERLKSETKHTEKSISVYEQRIKDLSTSQERVESENMMLRDQMAENGHSLLEQEVSWSRMLDALGGVDVGVALNSGNPAEKLKELGKYLRDLRMSLDSAEQESRKSKRAAELLLAELHEVQERNDSLQEELAKASHELSEVSREKNLAETAKSEALAHVDKLNIHSQEKDRQLSELVVLKSGVDQMREALLATERELDDVLSKDLEVLHCVEAMVKSFIESHGNPELRVPLPREFAGGVKSTKSENKVLIEIGSLRERLYNHSHLLHEKTRQLTEVVRNVQREYTTQKDSYEAMKRDVMQLESIEKEKESELHVLRRNISLLHETCTRVILEIENWKNCVVGNALTSNLKSQMSIEEVKSFTNDKHIFTEEGIRGMHEKLLLAVRDFMSMQSELMEDGQREMKSTLLNLQKELQEKDIQRDRICVELVNQIKEAETTAKNYHHELQQVRGSLNDSQGQVVVMKEERGVLEQRIKELKDQETNSSDSLQKISSLTDALAAKEQENEALMQALDEEEAQMEELANKIGTLENELQQKNQEMENIETSRSKALKKLTITVSKFDELHCLSENLLSEVEKLQSQLQERDGEISFLRQEVTRCTNDALAVTQMTKKRNSDEIHDVLIWLDSLISRVKVQDMTSDYKESHQVNEYREMLQKQIISLVSELENLRLVAQNNDMLLQHERTKVEEFAQKEQLLKTTLREMESQILTLQGAGDFVKPTNSTSEIVEVEQMKNNWGPQGTTSQQVRSLRKTNNDQVAIAIDMDQNSDRLEDDDDKAHGFKSLTTSKIVPRFTRPISDMVDGLWVSCDRALMRQPALRLGVIIYWAILHALLATFVV